MSGRGALGETGVGLKFESRWAAHLFAGEKREKQAKGQLRVLVRVHLSQN